MEKISIAVAGPNDGVDLARLRARWMADGQPPDAAFVARFERWLTDERGHRTFWIARSGPEAAAVGMVNLVTADRMPSPHSLDNGRWGYLGNMFVVDEARNVGLGQRLLTAVLDHAEAIGVVRIMLNPTERSRPFYTRAGFTPAANRLLIRQQSG